MSESSPPCLPCLPVFSEGSCFSGCNSFVLLCSNVFLSRSGALRPSPPLVWVQGLLLAAFQEIKMDKLRGRVRAGVGSAETLAFQRGWTRGLGARGGEPATPPCWARRPRPCTGLELLPPVTQADSFGPGETRRPEEKRTLRPGSSGCLSSECPGQKGAQARTQLSPSSAPAQLGAGVTLISMARVLHSNTLV